MQPPKDSQQSSNIVKSSSDNTQVVSDSDEQMQSHSNPVATPAVTLKLPGSGFSLNLNKWGVLGVFWLAIIVTFFVLTKGSEFCFFSTCLPPIDPTDTLAMNFWAFAGGTTALVVLTTLFGVSLVPAVAASFGVWFLIHLTLH